MTKIRQLASPVLKKIGGRKINWYPGHMLKGMKAMMAKLMSVDCVLEVHDARIPFSGRNREFKKQLGVVKPTVLILNKVDLADMTNWLAIKERLQSDGDNDILVTDLSGTGYNNRHKGYEDIGQIIMTKITSSERYNREDSMYFQVMIAGIPNVGKSTLINRLRQHYLGLKGEPALVGARAGVTRHVTQNIKICAKPEIYVIDTPGILHPSSLKSEEEGYKIALCSSVNDDVIDVEQLARFLLDLLNKRGLIHYTNVFGMNRPASRIEELVSYGALDLGLETITQADVLKICWKFIKGFRKGQFGQVMLDDIR